MCLAKNPNERYPTAGALADDLRRFHDGEPVSVRPAGYLIRTAKWVKRNPVPTALIVALLALVGVTIAGARLTQAEQEQRLLDSYKARMTLALQRGEGMEAVKAYDEAVAAGLKVSADMHLDKARGYEAANNSTASRAELASLNRAALSPERLCQADLLEGELLVGLDDARSRDLLTRAIADERLSKADRLYAQGLLAPSTEDALALFRAAIEEDAAHLSARGVYGLALFSLGRTDELIRHVETSRPFAPKHPQFPLLSTVAYTFKGDRANASQQFEALRGLYPNEPQFVRALDSLRVIIDTAVMLLAVRREGRALTTRETLTLTTFALNISSLGRDLQLLGGGNQFVGFRLPLCIRNGVHFLMSELVSAGDELGEPRSTRSAMLQTLQQFFVQFDPSPSIFNFTDEAGAAAARAKLATHPEGFLKYTYATRLQTLAFATWRTSGGSDESCARLAEVAIAYEDAAKTPSLLGHETYSYAFAVTCYGLAGVPIPGRPARTEYNRKAAEVARRWVLSAYPPREAMYYGVLVQAVVRGGDFLLAKQLLGEWAKFKPGPEYNAQAALVDFHFGAYHSTLENLDKAIPDGNYRLNAHNEFVLARDESRRRLGLPEWVPPPRRVYEPAPAPRAIRP